MSKTTFYERIKEIASILGSIYSIVLISSIVVTALIQVIPYLFQPWVVDVVRIMTPILVAVLISYILIRRATNSIYRAWYLSNQFFAVHSQVLVFVLTATMRHSGQVENLKPLVNSLRKLDEAYESGRAIPLVGFMPSSLLEYAIFLAKQWNIPFETLCTFLIENFGKERLRKSLESAFILEIYGKECFSTWNELIKS